MIGILGSFPFPAALPNDTSIQDVIFPWDDRHTADDPFAALIVTPTWRAIQGAVKSLTRCQSGATITPPAGGWRIRWSFRTSKPPYGEIGLSVFSPVGL